MARDAGSGRACSAPCAIRRRRSTSSWRCSPIRRGGCTWATCATTRSATSSRGSVACRASRCSIRWAGTPLGCRRRTPPSRPACIRATGRCRTSATCASSSCCSGCLRLEPRSHQLRAGVLRPRAAHLHRDVEARPGLSQGGDGQLVPQGPDGARQRAGRGRAVLALPLGRAAARARAVVPEGHRIRRRLLADAARASGPTRSCACRSTGLAAPRARASFPIRRSTGATSVEVFTTRPDTLYGVTFMSIAAEHPLVQRVSRRAPSLRRRDRQRGQDQAQRPRTTRSAASTPGLRARHPLTGARCRSGSPTSCSWTTARARSWRVPAHDQRDFEFATHTGCRSGSSSSPRARRSTPRRWKRRTPARQAGQLGEFDGLDNETAKAKITLWRRRGEATVSYRLRDWLLSRQRYWGAPIPMVYCETHGSSRCPRASCRCGCPTT